MNYNLKLIMALALGSLVAVSSNAQNKSANREHPARASANRQPGPVREIVRERITKLAADLNLTNEQKARLRDHLQNQLEKRQALRNATPPERRQLARALRDELDAKMKEVLTGEQYQKWQTRRTDLSERPVAPGGKQRPAPVQRSKRA